MMTLLMLAAYIPSTPDLGKAEGQCRPGEQGPAFIVDVNGLKDRAGLLKLEAYPPNEDDFLADDNVLVMAGKTFRRVEMPVPQSGPVQMCIRVPAPGDYALMLLHDRDSSRKMTLSTDGIGLPSNKQVCWGRPKVKTAIARAGTGLTHINLTLMYRSGVVCFAPLKK
jgi:uncharacterized protein (DUF2141 family)